MYLARVEFGQAHKSMSLYEAEMLIQGYLVAMLRNGQLCQDYLFSQRSRRIQAYTYVARPNAWERRYLSQWGKNELSKVVEGFGREPRWTVLEEARERFASWKNASALYLFTDWTVHMPPVATIDAGLEIPAYLLPLTDEQRDSIYSWAFTFRTHDRLWMESGKLEIPAYRQLAEVDSDVSREGREVCRMIEKATGIATYYCIYKYWGRKDDDVNRVCPCCGGKWRVMPIGHRGERFEDFPFQCKKCRVVSLDACTTDDARHARIGEYRHKD